jgi:hypothetical protein
MRDYQHRFSSLLGQLPARLTAEQAAWVLNCPAHDVPVLVVAHCSIILEFSGESLRAKAAKDRHH